MEPLWAGRETAKRKLLAPGSDRIHADHERHSSGGELNTTGDWEAGTDGRLGKNTRNP